MIAALYKNVGTGMFIKFDIRSDKLYKKTFRGAVRVIEVYDATLNTYKLVEYGEEFAVKPLQPVSQVAVWKYL